MTSWLPNRLHARPMTSDYQDALLTTETCASLSELVDAVRNRVGSREQNKKNSERTAYQMEIVSLQAERRDEATFNPSIIGSEHRIIAR